MIVKKLIVSLYLSSVVFLGFGQHEVSKAEMTKIYEEAKTPYKYGLVIAPADKDHMADCPTIFRYKNNWYMTYLVFDGRGYETWLAQSNNLLEWSTKGRLLSFLNKGWDANQRGGFPSLPDMEWGGSYKLNSYKGKYWMTYIGGANSGYEAIPLKIGLAWTPKAKMGKAEEWQSLDAPILSPEDQNGQWFDNITQYKTTIYRDKQKMLGVPFVMFYNAAGKHPETGLKAERVGIALSDDLKNWKRYPGNPVFSHEIANTITGDAHIQRFGNLYVMFYFSAFIPSKPYKAYNTFACSYDLVHWSDWQGADLVFPTEEYDDRYAHKSYLIKHKGIVYHFYCAVNEQRQRGIAVAVSKPMGQSKVNFPKLENAEKTGK